MNEVIETKGNDMLTLMETNASFCTLVPETPEEEIRLFNAINNPVKSVREISNTIEYITDFFMETVPVVNQETGVAEVVPRIILINKDMEGIATMSQGVYNALRKVIAIFGMPGDLNASPLWQEGLPFEFKLINKDKKQILTFNIKM